VYKIYIGKYRYAPIPGGCRQMGFGEKHKWEKKGKERENRKENEKNFVKRII
jgi:hypothetical protein